MPSTANRKLIVKAVADYLSARYNTTTGTQGKWFREVRRGVLKPGAKMRPCVTVTDGGQRRDPEGETAEGSCRILVLSLTLQLDENWDRVASVETWQDRVEAIISDLNGYLPTGFGVERIQYVQDDPVDLVFAEGQSEAGWTITFEALYVVDE